jgi:hypothetical protein
VELAAVQELAEQTTTRLKEAERAREDLARKLPEIAAAHEAEVADTISRAAAAEEAAMRSKAEVEKELKAVQQKHDELSKAYSELQRSVPKQLKEHEQRFAALEEHNRLLAGQLDRAHAERDGLVAEIKDGAQRRGAELGDSVARAEALGAENQGLLQRLAVLEDANASMQQEIATDSRQLQRLRADVERGRHKSLMRCEQTVTLRLYRTVLMRWRQCMRQHSEHTEIVARMLHYRMGRALDHWIQYMVEQFAVRTTIFNQIQRLQRARASRAIHRWSANTVAQRSARCQVNRRVLQNAWHLWTSFVAATQRQHEKIIRFVDAMRHKYLFLAFHGWTNHSEEMGRLRDLAVLAMKRLIKLKLTAVMHMWYSYAEHCRAVDSTMMRAMNHWYADKLSRGFQGWTMGAYRARRLRFVVSRVQERWCREMYRKCLVLWHRLALEEQSIRAADGAIEQVCLLCAQPSHNARLTSALCGGRVYSMLRGMQRFTSSNWMHRQSIWLSWIR